MQNFVKGLRIISGSVISFLTSAYTYLVLFAMSGLIFLTLGVYLVANLGFALITLGVLFLILMFTIVRGLSG